MITAGQKCKQSNKKGIENKHKTLLYYYGCLVCLQLSSLYPKANRVELGNAWRKAAVAVRGVEPARKHRVLNTSVLFYKKSWLITENECCAS